MAQQSDLHTAGTPGRSDLQTWTRLEHHRDEVMAGKRIDALFDEDADRFGRFNRATCGMILDFSKVLLTDDTLSLLLHLAHECDVEHRRNEMMSGQPINTTEGRAVLHTALRRMDRAPVLVEGYNVVPDVEAVIDQMAGFVASVHDGSWTGRTGKRITDVVNLGIGGSDLGPRMVCHALKPYADKGIRAHFVSNVDGADLAGVLEAVDPETTLFIIASKSFTTIETMTNARSARDWFLAQGGSEADVAKHFVAVSTNLTATKAFGIDERNVFAFWDWVGGRYSLWSSIGLSIALYLGMDRFNALRQGAHRMDRHFSNTPLDQNLPVLMALIGVWHANFLNYQSWALLPYTERLALLPAYLQQADMESNGKRVTRDGVVVPYQTAPVLWGGTGTDVQHSFFQHLHQGTQIVPADFIGIARPEQSRGDHHRLLMANFFAQTEALMRGRSLDEARTLLAGQGRDAGAAAAFAPHATFPGDRPTQTLLIDELTPERLGSLIALYEHKIFVQGVIWDINSFDQFGVELGKILAKRLLDGGAETMSASTRGLIGAYNNDSRDGDRL